MRIYILELGLVVAWIASLPLWATVGDTRVTSILRAHGYVDSRTWGYRYFACGDDLFVTKVTARAPTGEPVRGYVCCGLFKACTLRWEE